VSFTVFWDAMTYGSVDEYQCFGGTCHFYFQGKKISCTGKTDTDMDKREPGLRL
jgi:hypothetical protein